MGDSDCPVCRHKDNISVTNKILKGDMGLSEAMEHFGISDRKVLEKHLKEHIRVLSSEDGVVAVQRTEIDGIGLLTKLATRLDEIAEGLLDEIKQGDVTNLRAVNDTVREIRGCVKTIGELKGDIVTGIRVELQLQQNTINRLQSWMMENLCEEDKAKVLKFLGAELGME